MSADIKQLITTLRNGIGQFTDAQLTAMAQRPETRETLMVGRQQLALAREGLEELLPMLEEMKRIEARIGQALDGAAGSIRA